METMTHPGAKAQSGDRAQLTLTNYQGNLQPKGFPPLPEGFVSETETFDGVAPSVKLFGVLHKPSKPAPDAGKRPHRLLVIVHGYGEHGGRYLHFPHYLKSTWDSFYCLDMRGHGRSEGLRGHVDRYDDYAGDTALAIQRLYDRMKGMPGVEIDLLGHSMGGLTVLRVAYVHPEVPIKNLIVSAPLLGIAVKVSPVKTAAAKVLSGIWGTLHMKNDIDVSTLSRDKEVGIAYLADRLVSFKGTPRWYTETLKAMDDTMSRKGPLPWPMLLLVPTADKVVDESRALSYFENLGHPDKELKKYEGYFHEPFNEIGKERVFEDVIQWVKKTPLNSQDEAARRRLVSLVKRLSYREGDFTLASGKKSKFYVDLKATTLHPEGAKLIGQVATRVILTQCPLVQGVGGLTLGADPLATAISIAGLAEGCHWPAFIVRKEAKGHGTGKYIEGTENLRVGARLLVLEDVVTTGGSSIQAVHRLRDAGYEPTAVLTVVDREQGGAEGIRKLGLQFLRLATLKEIQQA